MPSTEGTDSGRSPSDGPQRAIDLEQIQMALTGVRYGEVRVLIQDGVVVQIERVEKRRLR